MDYKFRKAVDYGDLETVRRLLEHDNVNVDAENEFGNTALIWASARGHKEIVKILLDNDANVNASDDDGETALIWASYFGYKEIVQLLLEKNADLNIANNDGKTALDWAKQFGRSEIMSLLEKEPEKRQRQKEEMQKLKSTYKTRVALDMKIQELRDIIETTRASSGVQANQRGIQAEKELQSLLFLCDLDEYKTIATLESEVANIEKKLAERFVNAARNGDLETVRLLMERDNFNAVNEHGSKALRRASYRGHKDIVKLLLDNDANVNATSDYGETALICASWKGHKETVELLLEKDANVNAVNEMGYTALMCASQSGYKDIVQLLLAKNADPNITENYGMTALYFAKERGHDEIVVLLLNYEIDLLEDKLDRGGSPQGMKTMLQKLLKKKQELKEQEEPWRSWW